MLLKKAHKLALLKIALILIGIVFFFLLMSLPEFIETISDNRIKFYVKLSMLLFVLALVVYTAYSDFKYERFRTRKFILIVDMIEFISLIVLSFLVMQNNDIIDIDKLIRQSKITICALIVLFCTTLLKAYLKSKNFSKEINKTNHD